MLCSGSFVLLLSCLKVTNSYTVQRIDSVILPEGWLAQGHSKREGEREREW